MPAKGWSEITRTEAMIKKEGKTLAASIKQSAYYGGEPEKTGYIVNAAGVMEVFTDVAKDTWYHDAVVWCTVNDLVKGIGNNIFLCTRAPDAQIT